MAQPDFDMLNRRRFLTDATKQAITTTPVLISTVAPGVYDVYCDVECRWIQGGAAVAMADNTKGRPHPARTFIESVFISGTGDNYFKVAASSAAGTFELILKS